MDFQACHSNEGIGDVMKQEQAAVEIERDIQHSLLQCPTGFKQALTTQTGATFRHSSTCTRSDQMQ